MNIRNTISMTDRMTPVFRSITKAMQSTLTSLERLDKASNKGKTSVAFQHAQRDVQKANNEIIKMQNYLAGADKKAQNVAKSAGKIKSSFSNISGGSGLGFNLMGLTSALYLVTQLADALAGVADTADTARSQVARIGIFNTGTGTPDELYAQAYKTALATRSDFTETGNLATRIMMSDIYQGDDAGRNSIALAGVINKALVAGGSKTEENNRALLQLSQGLASGTLQGDELRSIREQTPYLTRVIAEGLGKAYPEVAKFKDLTMGDLKALGAQGELTATRIAAAFEAMQEQIDADFQKMPRTFGQAMTNVNTVWQYFLYLLSQGDGALAKINTAAWEFADWLATEEGWAALQDLADVLAVVAEIAITAFRGVGSVISWLRDNTAVAQAGVVALGAAAVAAALGAFVAWAAACWPVLLFAAVVGAAVYLLLQAGYSIQQIVGGIVGVLYFIGVGFYDAVIILVEAVWAIISTVWDVILAVGESIGAVFQILAGAIEAVCIVIVTLISGMATSVLKIISSIAGGIDAVFGTSLATGVNSWIDTLGAKTQSVVDSLGGNIKANFDIGTQFKDAPWADFNAVADWRMSNGIEMLNPLGAYDYGAKTVSGWANGIGDTTLNQDNLKNIEGYIEKISGGGGTTVNGGNLDSVGKIGSSVDLSEEDIKLLKDIAAKEFLINLATLTPSMEVKFGDVHETADVGAIMEVIEQMAEEALATSLV